MEQGRGMPAWSVPATKTPTANCLSVLRLPREPISLFARTITSVNPEEWRARAEFLVKSTSGRSLTEDQTLNPAAAPFHLFIRDPVPFFVVSPDAELRAAVLCKSQSAWEKSLFRPLPVLDLRLPHITIAAKLTMWTYLRHSNCWSTHRRLCNLTAFSLLREPRLPLARVSLPVRFSCLWTVSFLDWYLILQRWGTLWHLRWRGLYPPSFKPPSIAQAKLFSKWRKERIVRHSVTRYITNSLKVDFPAPKLLWSSRNPLPRYIGLAHDSAPLTRYQYPARNRTFMWLFNNAMVPSSKAEVPLSWFRNQASIFLLISRCSQASPRYKSWDLVWRAYWYDFFMDSCSRLQGMAIDCMLWLIRIDSKFGILNWDSRRRNATWGCILQWEHLPRASKRQMFAWVSSVLESGLSQVFPFHEGSCLQDSISVPLCQHTCKEPIQILHKWSNSDDDF